MDFFLKWLLFAGVQTAATISPGPAFAMVVRNAVIYDRRTGLFTSVGLGLGVGVHVALTLGGIAVILAHSIWLFNVVKYGGAAYLVYMGVKALQARKPIAEPADNDGRPQSAKRQINALQALRIGFLTNLLNPKAVVFFTAVFTQFIEPQASAATLIFYGMTSVIVEILWFSLLTSFLNDERVKSKFKAVSHWIERCCGGLLLTLGVRLALSKMH